MAFYVALTRGNEIEFNEVYENEADARNRVRVLELEGAGRGYDPADESTKWMAYRGHEPIESFLARKDYIVKHPLSKDATEEDVRGLERDAEEAALTAKTKAVPGEVPVDDAVRSLKCSKGHEYGLDHDFCPVCGERPGHSKAILDANAEAQLKQEEARKAAEAEAAAEGPKLMKERLIENSINDAKDKEVLRA